MSTVFEYRLSDSPYIEIIWRGQFDDDYAPVCPADVRWNLLFSKYNNGEVQVTVEGATTQHVPKYRPIGAEFLVIKFRQGVFMPNLPVANLVNRDALLAGAANNRFCLNDFTWQLPDFENVESFVDRLVKEDILLCDPIIAGTLENKVLDVSSRTIRRRFLRSTGLTPKLIEQIERAQQAQTLLENGISILDAVYELGYSDQPHMTRSLKRFIGQTPGEILAQI